MTENEAKILFHLYANADKIISIDDIIIHLYPDPDEEPDMAYVCVTVFISQIRKKYGYNSIITIPRWGYSAPSARLGEQWLKRTRA